MKKFMWGMFAVIVCATFISAQAMAISKDYTKKGTPAAEGSKEAAPEKAAKEERSSTKFPEKGWHKGPYVAANIGMMQETNDKHAVTGNSFNGAFDLAFGLTFGWDIADWIGPMLQINYATATGGTGNGGAAVGVYPAGTFPSENARQHAVDLSLFAKATLPYFTHAEWQWNNLKILPYAKLGGTGYGMIVNSKTNANKVGAYGGGPAIGLGCEFFIWKGLFIALDATEHLIFQGSHYETIAGTRTKVTDSGFKPHFSLYGLFGWHF